MFLLTDAELDVLARTAADAQVEVSLFARPNAAWGLSATARAHAGFAAAAHGQEQVVANLEDCVRAAAHGFRSVLIADLGVLSLFSRGEGRRPAPGRHAGEGLRDAARRERRERTRPRAPRRGDDQPADRPDAAPDRRRPRGRRRAARRLRRGARQRRRLRAAPRDPRADPGRRPGLRQVRPPQRAGRLPRRDAPRGDDGRPLAASASAARASGWSCWSARGTSLGRPTAARPASPFPPSRPPRRDMARPVTLFTGQWADLPLDDLAAKAGGWGFDGLELACWGDHFEVDKALADDGYCRVAAGAPRAQRPRASGRSARTSSARPSATGSTSATARSCRPRSTATAIRRASAGAPPSG